MDILSNEYGWTTEYILSRTFKEIEYRLYAIDRRKKIEQSNKIALAGGKPRIAIPKRRAIKEKTEKSPEEILFDNKVQDAFNQRLKEWQKK